MKFTLPTDSEERKNIKLRGGCLNYFPAALAGVARWSKIGNDKHNEGSDVLFHARGKSNDHEETIERHGTDLADILAAIERQDPKTPSPALIQAALDEYDARSWRALAASQEFREKYCGAPLAPAARLPDAPLPITAEFVAQKLVNSVSNRYGGRSGEVGGSDYPLE